MYDRTPTPRSRTSFFNQWGVVGERPAHMYLNVTGSGKRARNSLLLHTRYTRSNGKSLTSANFNLRHRWVGQHVGNVRTKFQSQPARSSKVIDVFVTAIQ